MQPFRKNVAIAIDGGGIRGVIVTRALALLEQHLGQSVNAIFRLTAGTSTGSIISAGIGAGLSADQMYKLYVQLGDTIFRKTLHSELWVITKYRYPHEPLADALKAAIGDKVMGDFWKTSPQTDVVITCFDLVENRTRFVKPWKDEYANWPVLKAVLASSSVPTYFPAVEGRYVDGGVGAYANPCYYAAYEAQYHLKWNPAETTLISLGTGHFPTGLKPGQANKLWPWQWLDPVLGAFLQSADTQQVHLVGTLFGGLDFRRFQVDMQQNIGMDDVSKMAEMTKYGDELGRKILADDWVPLPDLSGLARR